VAGFARPEGSQINRKPHPIVIHSSSPAPISGRGTFIVLDQANEIVAIEIAQKLARHTGRRVTIRDAISSRIQTIPAASLH
jgi:hypothetical protein